uniref:Glucose-6-phosphate exchanger SLC37A2 n=1 Tax=Sarcophilus harrisii TaxID=9305 RepID=A0A7N4P0U7_SARHA
MRSSLAPGIWLLRAFSRDSWYRGLILLLTFLIYTCYHLSRKPISVVKSQLHRNCTGLENPNNNSNSTTWCSWAPFDQENYKELLGGVDDAFLIAYAVGMFISGIFGERLSIRYYLFAGMLLSGILLLICAIIHVLLILLFLQLFNGLAQTTGWPSVVTCVGNWFGKEGKIYHGIWNSHTSVGNILGSLIAGIWVDSAWGLSFIVPGIIIAVTGVISFFFLVESKCGLCPPQHHVTLLTSFLPFWFPEKLVTRNIRLGVVEFSLCLLFAKLVSYTFLFWLPSTSYFVFSTAHFGPKEAGDLSTLFDVGGIIGQALCACFSRGIISDYTNGRATTCCVMLIVAAPMLFLYNSVGQNGIGSSVVMLIICGALVNGPYALITTAVSADLGTHKSLRGNAKALSTVAAIIDGTGSIGAALGPLLAGLISPTGWNNVFYMLISADILACLFLSRLVYKEIQAWRRSENRNRG